MQKAGKGWKGNNRELISTKLSMSYLVRINDHVVFVMEATLIYVSDEVHFLLRNLTPLQDRCHQLLGVNTQYCPWFAFNLYIQVM